MARKRTKYDLIDEEILNYQTMNQTSYVPTDELFYIFQSHLDIPSNEILRDRYIANKISAYLGRLKNRDGTRKFLSTGNGGFSLIESEKDVTNLDGVLNQLNKRVDGLNKNIRKAEQQKFMAKNQLTIDDIATNNQEVQ